MTPLDRLLEALPHGATRNGAGWSARCPGHEDEHASLSINEGEDGRVLLHCHAGCSARAIAEAIGLTLADLFPPRDDGEQAPEVVYDYRDEFGEPLFQVVRFPGKKFRQRRPDPGGGWVWRLGDARRVLYRLPELKGHAAVFVTEGEKDVERLRALGLTATTNPHGAGKWRSQYVEQLKAAGVQRVCVLPDNDAPGAAHGRAVADTCHAAGLFTKLVALPGLPEHGDVSDWLNAGHTKAELLEAVKAAPPYNPGRLVAQPPKLQLTSLADLLAEPDNAIEWLVEDRIPAGAIVLLAGKPKAGKSTLARGLAFALVTGEPWLGWRTQRGAVWYLALEDKRSEVRRHFRQLGATGAEPLRLFFDQAGPELLPALHALADQERPAAIVVDTLQRLIGAKDLNDYAEVTTRCAPLLRLARETGATLILVHHANKFGDGLDSILGSTALTGTVDNVLLLSRSDRYRTLSSVQRIGPDLEPVVIALDSTTGHLEAAGSKQDADEHQAAEKILDALADAGEPVPEKWIKANVDARRQDQVRGLRLLLRRGLVQRTGRGGKADPFRYVVVDSGSHDICTVQGTSILIPSSSSSGDSDLFTSTPPSIAGNTNNDGPDSGSHENAESGAFYGQDGPDSGSRALRVPGTSIRPVNIGVSQNRPDSGSRAPEGVRR